MKKVYFILILVSLVFLSAYNTKKEIFMKSIGKLLTQNDGYKLKNIEIANNIC